MSLRFRDVMSSFVSRGGCTETCVEDPLDAESGNLRWSDDADNAAALEDGRGASPAGLCWEHESGDNVLPLHSDGDPPREPLALHIRSELSAVGSPASLKERVPSSPGILTDGGSRGEVQYNTESKNAHVVPPASWSVEDTTHPIFSPGCGVLNNNDASVQERDEHLGSSASLMLDLPFRSFFHTDPPPAMYDHWDTEVSSWNNTPHNAVAVSKDIANNSTRQTEENASILYGPSWPLPQSEPAGSFTDTVTRLEGAARYGSGHTMSSTVTAPYSRDAQSSPASSLVDHDQNIRENNAGENTNSVSHDETDGLDGSPSRKRKRVKKQENKMDTSDHISLSPSQGKRLAVKPPVARHYSRCGMRVNFSNVCMLCGSTLMPVKEDVVYCSRLACLRGMHVRCVLACCSHSPSRQSSNRLQASCRSSRHVYRTDTELCGICHLFIRERMSNQRAYRVQPTEGADVNQSVVSSCRDIRETKTSSHISGPVSDVTAECLWHLRPNTSKTSEPLRTITTQMLRSLRIHIPTPKGVVVQAESYIWRVSAEAVKKRCKEQGLDGCSFRFSASGFFEARLAAIARFNELVQESNTHGEPIMDLFSFPKAGASSWESECAVELRHVAALQRRYRIPEAVREYELRNSEMAMKDIPPWLSSRAPADQSHLVFPPGPIPCVIEQLRFNQAEHHSVGGRRGMKKQRMSSSLSSVLASPNGPFTHGSSSSTAIEQCSSSPGLMASPFGSPTTPVLLMTPGSSLFLDGTGAGESPSSASLGPPPASNLPLVFSRYTTRGNVESPCHPGFRGFSIDGESSAAASSEMLSMAIADSQHMMGTAASSYTLPSSFTPHENTVTTSTSGRVPNSASLSPHFVGQDNFFPRFPGGAAGLQLASQLRGAPNFIPHSLDPHLFASRTDPLRINPFVYNRSHSSSSTSSLDSVYFSQGLFLGHPSPFLSPECGPSGMGQDAALHSIPNATGRIVDSLHHSSAAQAKDSTVKASLSTHGISCVTSTLQQPGPRSGAASGIHPQRTDPRFHQQTAFASTASSRCTQQYPFQHIRFHSTNLLHELPGVSPIKNHDGMVSPENLAERYIMDNRPVDESVEGACVPGSTSSNRSLSPTSSSRGRKTPSVFPRLHPVLGGDPLHYYTDRGSTMYDPSTIKHYKNSQAVSPSPAVPEERCKRVPYQSASVTEIRTGHTHTHMCDYSKAAQNCAYVSSPEQCPVAASEPEGVRGHCLYDHQQSNSFTLPGRSSPVSLCGQSECSPAAHGSLSNPEDIMEYSAVSPIHCVAATASKVFTSKTPTACTGRMPHDPASSLEKGSVGTKLNADEGGHGKSLVQWTTGESLHMSNAKVFHETHSCDESHNRPSENSHDLCSPYTFVASCSGAGWSAEQSKWLSSASEIHVAGTKHMLSEQLVVPQDSWLVPNWASSRRLSQERHYGASESISDNVGSSSVTVDQNNHALDSRRAFHTGVRSTKSSGALENMDSPSICKYSMTNDTTGGHGYLLGHTETTWPKDQLGCGTVDRWNDVVTSYSAKSERAKYQKRDGRGRFLPKDRSPPLPRERRAVSLDYERRRRRQRSLGSRRSTFHQLPDNSSNTSQNMNPPITRLMVSHDSQDDKGYLHKPCATSETLTNSDTKPGASGLDFFHSTSGSRSNTVERRNIVSWMIPPTRKSSVTVTTPVPTLSGEFIVVSSQDDKTPPCNVERSLLTKERGNNQEELEDASTRESTPGSLRGCFQHKDTVDDGYRSEPLEQQSLLVFSETAMKPLVCNKNSTMLPRNQCGSASLPTGASSSSVGAERPFLKDQQYQWSPCQQGSVSLFSCRNAMLTDDTPPVVTQQPPDASVGLALLE